MTTYNQIKATVDSVGEWEGQEQLAAENLNRIYMAIFNAAGENYDEDKLSQTLHSVWDDWGSDEKLLSLTEKEINDYVSRII